MGAKPELDHWDDNADYLAYTPHLSPADKTDNLDGLRLVSQNTLSYFWCNQIGFMF